MPNSEDGREDGRDTGHLHGHAAYALGRRRTMVLLVLSFLVPLVALILLWAFEGTEPFLRWVMVGVTLLSITAAWATSGMPVEGGRDGLVQATNTVRCDGRSRTVPRG